MAYGAYYSGYQPMAYQQPQLNPYQQQNPYQYQQYQQYQQPQVGTQMSLPNQQTLNGQMVDGIEAVKAKDVDMSGNPTFYPNINGMEIYKKQLQPDGTCSTIIYKRMEESAQNVPKQDIQYVDISTFNSTLEQMQSAILNEIDGIKSMITPKSTRGGAEK